MFDIGLWPVRMARAMSYMYYALIAVTVQCNGVCHHWGTGQQWYAGDVSQYIPTKLTNNTPQDQLVSTSYGLNKRGLERDHRNAGNLGHRFYYM